MTDTLTADTPLTAAETSTLKNHEEIIGRGLKTFIEVGTALQEIHDQHLYRATHATFGDYCRDRWDLSRARGYELISAAQVASRIPDTMPKPKNAGQAAALAQVAEEQQAEVWATALEITNGKPTAAAVQKAHEQQKAPGKTTKKPPVAGKTPAADAPLPPADAPAILTALNDVAAVLTRNDWTEELTELGPDVTPEQARKAQPRIDEIQLTLDALSALCQERAGEAADAA